MKKEQASLLGNPSQYSLEQLIKDSQYIGSTIKGRSYGSVIDQIIDKHKNRKNLESLVFDNKKLFVYLGAGRTDYILEFPAIRSFFEFDLGIKPDIVNISIEEAKPYNMTYVTCVKNEWGRQLMNRIDLILKEYIHSKKHRDATLRWYHEADRQQLSKIYDEVLINR